MGIDVTGGCLCGGVTYAAKDAATDLTACHCRQCRKTTGHHFATTNALKENIALSKDETLAWYAASEVAERGFCNKCGSSLFWRPHNLPYMGILAGTIDNSEGMRIVRHIFVDDQGEYYDLPDDIPQFSHRPPR